MQFEPFPFHFPKLGTDECRSVCLPDGGARIPPGRYAFVEHYCTDPDCDCRCVMFVVIRDVTCEHMAVIRYGFDADDSWRGPMLNPLNRQSKCAGEFLELAEKLVLADPRYQARLERHYRLFKNAMRRGGSRRQPKSPSVDEPLETTGSQTSRRLIKKLQKRMSARMRPRR